MNKVPPRLDVQSKRKARKQNRVIASVVNKIEAVMNDAVEKIIETSLFSEKYFEPTFNGVEVAIEQFFIEVISEAYKTSEEEKTIQTRKEDEKAERTKRLAKGPVGIPKDLRSLEKIFRDPKKAKALKKKSKKLYEQIKKDYLQKLKRRFKEVLPKVLNGELSPKEAKAQMRQVWGASKSRVETIFRTETTNYFGKVQTSFFSEDDDILGFMFDANIDTSVTDICRSRHGMIYRWDHKDKDSISYNTPALHYNCRSHLIPLANTPENRKLIEDSSRDPAKNRSKIKPLPKEWR